MITLRLASESDLHPLAAIYAECYRVADVGERWTPQTAETLLTYWLKRRPELFYVATVGNKLAGAFVTDVMPWWDGPCIFEGQLFVDPAYQKRGIGSLLFEKVLSEALRIYRAESIALVTYRNSTHPRSWYERIGLKETGYMILEGKTRAILKNLSNAKAVNRLTTEV